MEEQMQRLRQELQQEVDERRAWQLKNKQLKKAQKAAAQQAPKASAALLTGAAGEPAPPKDDEENQVHGASTMQDQHRVIKSVSYWPTAPRSATANIDTPPECF